MIAILGGTFDPVHRGHLAIARAALAVPGVTAAVLMPCALPPHKARPGLADPYCRFAMAALAAAGEPAIRCSPLELLRGGVSYTIDTLEELAARGVECPLLLMGTDSLAEIRTWRRWEEIVPRVRIGAVERPGFPWTAAIAAVPAGFRDRAILLPVASDGTSSSEIRRRVSEGEDLGALVPSSVAEFIRRQGLYRPPGDARTEESWP